MEQVILYADTPRVNDAPSKIGERKMQRVGMRRQHPSLVYLDTDIGVSDIRRKRSELW